jgi:hypothetical protein
VLLNVIILSLTSVIGLRLLVEGVRFVNALEVTEQTPPTQIANEHVPSELSEQKARSTRFGSANLRLLQLWLLLYAFVGTQLGWTLRPFFGVSDAPFQLFRAAEGNFYESVITMLRGLF